MPLFIDTSGLPNAVEADLFQLCRCDAGLGEEAISDPTAVQVVYTPSSSTIVRNRLNALVNTSTKNIVITGVDSSFILPDGTPVNTVAGETFSDPSQPSLIRVAYDVTQCGGAKYFVVGTGGTAISFPNPVLLYHELAHAFHADIGDLPADSASAEFQAETDENDLRDTLGLPHRDPTSHDGGCGFAGSSTVPDCTGTSGGGTGSISCFVASAAFGSACAPQVHLLRLVRDAWRRRSRLAGMFFATLLHEYYAFSPRLAVDMAACPSLNDMMRGMFVEPLICFVGLASAARGPLRHDRDVLERQARDALRAYLAASQLRHPALAPASTSAAMHALWLHLGGLNGPAPEGLRLRKIELPVDGQPAAVADYVAQVITSRQRGMECFRWAVAGLQLFWSRLEALHACGPIDRPERGGPPSWVDALDDWLAEVPLPSLFPSLGEDQLREELTEVGRAIFVESRVRSVLGARLLQAFSHQVHYDLDHTLRTMGWAGTPAVSPSPRRK